MGDKNKQRGGFFQLPLAAPGFRDAGNRGRAGEPVGAGYYGYCWSSAVSGIRGVYLDFYTQSLDPVHASNRAYGLQLRCLSE
ncbi:hypothetical protein [uncultured Rikenella sp.]|uniref:hypothetical protein n=1 Tax=uncultured Rikenella sp. TaxID=368003 RepID=UPI0025CD5D8D|nr:hypothetical protein [uncultured Rikenella sp.]